MGQYSRAVEWGAVEQKGAVVRGGAGRAEKEEQQCKIGEIKGRGGAEGQKRE